MAVCPSVHLPADGTWHAVFESGMFRCLLRFRIVDRIPSLQHSDRRACWSRKPIRTGCRGLQRTSHLSQEQSTMTTPRRIRRDLLRQVQGQDWVDICSGRHSEERPSRHQRHLRGLRHQEVPNRHALLTGDLPASFCHTIRTSLCWYRSSNHWIVPITHCGHLPMGISRAGNARFPPLAKMLTVRACDGFRKRVGSGYGSIRVYSRQPERGTRRP